MRGNRVIGIFMLAAACFSGCRGQQSGTPPIHLNPNMDQQAKYRPQRFTGKNPDHTVPWGQFGVYSKSADREDFIRSNAEIYRGQTHGNRWVQNIPRFYKLDRPFLLRGQNRFDIYCAICHDRAGTGRGTVASKGIGVVPSLREERIRYLSDGELFDVISRGKGAMPAYGKQIPVTDRWAIVGYVRALQNLEKFNKKGVSK